MQDMLSFVALYMLAITAGWVMGYIARGQEWTTTRSGASTDDHTDGGNTSYDGDST